MPRASAASAADRDTVLADSHLHHDSAAHDAGAAVAAAADNEDEQLEDDDDDDDDEQEIYGESPTEAYRQLGAAC